MEGVTNLNIDPDNRDGLLNSLLARFENAILKAGDAESENGIVIWKLQGPLMSEKCQSFFQISRI